MTGVVSPRVIASRQRIAAHMPRRGERVRSSLNAGRPCPAARAGCAPRPTVTTEPVTSTAPDAERVAERLAGLGQRGRLVDRVGQPRRDRDPVLTEDRAGRVGQLTGGQRPRRWSSASR